MWCKNCNIETNENRCPICSTETVEDIPNEIYWCTDCCVPVIQDINQIDKGICPVCGKSMKYLSTDLRPVFPEERLLIEIFTGAKPLEYVQKSVWAANNRYYINGESVVIPSKLYAEANTDEISKLIDEYKDQNTYEFFNIHIEKFLSANERRLHYLKDEAHSFIRKSAEKFDEENIVFNSK